MNEKYLAAIAKRNQQERPIAIYLNEGTSGEKTYRVLRRFHTRGCLSFLNFGQTMVSNYPIPLSFDRRLWNHGVFRHFMMNGVHTVNVIGESILKPIQYGTDTEREAFAAGLLDNVLEANTKAELVRKRLQLHVQLEHESIGNQHSMHNASIIAVHEDVPHVHVFSIVLDGWSKSCFSENYTTCYGFIETYNNIRKILLGCLRTYSVATKIKKRA